jgi:hypothetical protein
MADSRAVGTVGADITELPPISETQTTVARVLTDESGFLRSRARDLHQDTASLHQRSRIAEWAERTNERKRASTQELLEELADFGFAWRDIARLVGVSVAAVQKWRRGEGTTGDNKIRIASLLAACDLIADKYLIQEVASWFEMPVLLGVPPTPIDLWADNRPDLVLEHASEDSKPEHVLSAWDPEWREHYRSDFEVFDASDGNLAIRPKKR